MNKVHCDLCDSTVDVFSLESESINVDNMVLHIKGSINKSEVEGSPDWHSLDLCLTCLRKLFRKAATQLRFR